MSTQSTVSTVSTVSNDSLSTTAFSTADHDASESVTEKKARRSVDSASVAGSFDVLLGLIEGQINSLRATAATAPKSGNTGVKFLRTVASRVKQLKKDAVRVMDAPKKRPRTTTTTNGGFLKAHRVSEQMASFAGWNPDELKSRVQITKAICEYVKKNDLYEPGKRKNILPDAKLRDLLQYDPTVSGNEALTFFYLQKLIGNLQVKDAPKA